MKSTNIMNKGLGYFGLLTLLLIIGGVLAFLQQWYAVFFMIAVQLLTIRIWYNGYLTGWQIKQEVKEV